MNRYLRMMMFLVLLQLQQQVSAQSRVTGTLKDENNEAIIGATVIEEGTTNGTITDFDGHYTLSVSNDAVLIFSFVGFKTVKEAIAGRTVIDLQMEQDLEELEEVVVTAMGFKENKDNLGYANSVVSSESITKAGESTLLNSLSGKSSGVRISRNSGDPGAGAYIQIRGLSSITRDSQPLILVDGVPISNDVDGNGAGRIPQQSRLNDINPNDIESVSVLKGASAAALWGTKALGGVIMITTKSGKYNQKLKVSVKSSFSLDQISRLYPLQTKFGQGDNGVYSSTSRNSWGDKISARAGGQDEFNTSGEYYLDQDGKLWYPIITKNAQETYDDSNFDQIFHNGYFWENNVSLSAGNESSTVFFSISDLDQHGIIKNNSDYRRSSIRFNAERMLTDKLILNFNTTYARTASNRIRRGASSSGLYLGLLRNAPDFDISGYRGSYYESADASPLLNRHRSYRNQLGANNAGYNNPLWTINEQANNSLTNRSLNSLKLTYSPFSWLDLITRAGLDNYTDNREEFNTPGSAAGEYRTGFFETTVYTKTIFNMDYMAKATKNFRNYSLTGLVGFNFNQKQSTTNSIEISNFIQFTDAASPTRDIDNATPENRVTTRTFGMERTVGLYSSLTFSAWDMLFVNGTLRSEYASTFGENSKSNFLFPSTSIAWQVDQLMDVDQISLLKLRASYGEVGVQPSRYETTTTYVSPTYSDQYGGGLDLGLYGNGGFVPGTNLGNPYLRPERKREMEYGADIRLLNDRLSISGTYFDNVTEDVLLRLPLANTRGYSTIYQNAGELKNTGIELDLGATIIREEDFNWDMNLIYTKVNNMVTDLVGAEAVPLGGLDAVATRAMENQPVGVLWGSRTLRDEAGNIVFDANGFPVQDEQPGIIGNPNPDWQGSLATTISWKNLSLSALFETYQGADIFAGTKSALYDLGRWEASGTESTATQNLLNYNGDVIPMGTTFRGVIHDFGAGPVALTEAWYLADGGFFANGNDELYIEDGSWTRLRELTLAYSTSAPWINSIGIKSADLSLTGRNLFIWTEFEGNDPDTNLDGISSSRGIDYFNNPGTKSYVFTVVLNF